MLLSTVSKVLVSRELSYQWIHGFYEEKANSLDAVYIGSSSVYSYWQPALGWGSHGIAVWSYASAAQPIEAVLFLLEEMQKTQPDALKIIDVSDADVGEYSVTAKIHRMADHMPLSATKLRMIDALCNVEGVDPADRLEFYFPLYRYHSNWDRINRANFLYELDGTKGGAQHSPFLKESVDVSDAYCEFDQSGDLPEGTKAYLESLFDYIDHQGISVLFIANTSLVKDGTTFARVNRIMEMAEARGYDTLDLRGRQEELGIDTTTDYHNTGHMNVHGSIKYTEYLSDYLVAHYGFRDKRGQQVYESWDLAAEKYQEVLSPYVVVEELDAESYNGILKAPELTKLSGSGTSLTLRWKGVKGANTYHIYRKTGISGPWKFLASVSADTLSYKDEGLDLLQEYTYTVVPQQECDGKCFHGNYQFDGISAKTLPNTPELTELTGDELAQMLEWKKVPEADGYAILRKICGNSWTMIADVKEKTEYTDTDFLGGKIPLQYTVRAYVLDEEGERVFGSYDANGLLYLPEHKNDIGLTGSLEKGRIALSWDAVAGGDRYYIERRTEDGDWMQVTEPIAGNVTSFQDLTAERNVAYKYRVTAALTFRKEEYLFASQETEDWECSTEDSVIVDRPEIVFAQRIGKGVELVWIPASNASACRIYRRAEGTDWTVLEESFTGNSYTDSALPKKAREVSYLVQALYGPKGVVYEGEFSEGMAVTLDLEQEG